MGLTFGNAAGIVLVVVVKIEGRTLSASRWVDKVGFVRQNEALLGTFSFTTPTRCVACGAEF
jgi:hypothetical protein